MSKYITETYGYWQLKGELKQLLLECKAEESARYSFDRVSVEENKLVATDGRRLVEINIGHKIEPGLYFCTSDGFLLKTTEGKFPKYKDIIPAKQKLLKVAEITESGPNVTGYILGKIINAGCIISLSLYRKPVELLEQLIEYNTIEAYVDKKNPAKNPFVIEAYTLLGQIRYIQMPLDIKARE